MPRRPRSPHPRSRGRLLAAVAFFALAASAAGIARADPIDQRRHELEDRLSETRTQIARARSSEQALGREIAVQSDAIAAAETRAAGLGSEVAALEARLAGSRARLAVLTGRLEEQAEHLGRLRRDLATAQRLLDTRLVETYTSDRPELIDIALGAESLGSLIEGVEYYAALAEQDSYVVTQVRERRAAVARTRAAPARLRAEQAETTERPAQAAAPRRAAYASLVAERDRLGSLRQGRQRSLAKIEVSREEWEAEAQALETESARLASIITASPAPSSPAPSDPQAPPPSSSGFVWPVRGTVVSPFGPRWGRLHAGIDIAAPGGTPIAAAAAGTVIYSGSMSGYGNLVVIQHAGGIATAYAHNSSNAVSVGQPVAQGQTIASVGCTGRCFGDHVHFEVRVNGTPVDPMGYL